MKGTKGTLACLKEAVVFALLKDRDNNLQAASESAVLEVKILSYYLVKEDLLGE